MTFIDSAHYVNVTHEPAMLTAQKIPRPVHRTSASSSTRAPAVRAHVLFACLAQYTGAVLHSSPMTLALRLQAPLAASIDGGGASMI